MTKEKDTLNDIPVSYISEKQESLRKLFNIKQTFLLHFFSIDFTHFSEVKSLFSKHCLHSDLNTL